MDCVLQDNWTNTCSLACALHPHRHTHTECQANELFASMCCLHCWTVQRQTQRPPLKGQDSQDKPCHCISRSLVPQQCRISTHTSGLVVAASCGSGWVTVAGWIAWCLQIPNRLADSFICLSVGTNVNRCICVPFKLPVCLPDWAFNSELKPKQASNLFHNQYWKRKVCPNANCLSDLHVKLFLDLWNLLLREEFLWK